MPKKLQVQQLVLYLFDGLSTTDHMGLYGDVIAMLNGSCYGDGAWTTADALSLVLSVVQLLVDIFRVVRCDVDEGRIECGQLVDGLKQSFRAIALQGWQHFKGKTLLVGVEFNIVCYCHDSSEPLISYKIS